MGHKRNRYWGLVLFMLILSASLLTGRALAQTILMEATWDPLPSGWEGDNLSDDGDDISFLADLSTIDEDPKANAMIQVHIDRGASEVQSAADLQVYRVPLDEYSAAGYVETFSETTWSGYPALLNTREHMHEQNDTGRPGDSYTAPCYTEHLYVYVGPGVVVRMLAQTAVGPIYVDGRAGSQSMEAFQNVKAQMIQVARGIRVGPVGSRASSAPWQVVVDVGGALGAGAGVLVAGGILASAVATILSINRENRAKAGKDQEEQDPKQVVGYILQISSEAVMLMPKQPVSVNAAVWQVTADGATARAADSAIRVDVPGTAAGFLQVTPVSGQGQINCNFTQVGQPSQGEVLVKFNASAAQGGASAQVKVIMAVDLVAKAAQGQPVIRYVKAEKCWLVPDMLVYFCVRGTSTPVQVSFEYDFPKPEALCTAHPDLLVLEEARLLDDGMTWRVKMTLKEDKLEEAFGEHLTDEEGNLKLQVTAIPRDDQEPYDAEITYQLRPQVTMLAYSYDRGDTRASGGHTYNDESYDEMEFVADGVDTLPLALFFIRTDKEVSKELQYLEAEDMVEIGYIGWKADGDITDFNHPKVNEAQSGAGLFAYDLISSYGLKATKERIDRPHKLSVKARLKDGGPTNYELDQSDYEISVKPQFLKLQLWVTPGRLRGTSEAYAYLTVLPSGKPLPKQSLMLNIEDPPGSSLSLDRCSAVQHTRPEENYPENRGAALVKGSACWILRYKDLSWQTLPQAVYRLSCEWAGKDSEITLEASVTIDLNDNVGKMLRAMLTDKKITPKINNPFWVDEDTPANARRMFSALNEKVPLYARGPLYNIAWIIPECLGKESPYVCRNLQDSICEWLDQRRHYDSGEEVKNGMILMHCMNGIEYDHYAMRPFHVWASFFLSGNDRYKAYKALDPWWEQKWKDPSYASPDGLMDNIWGERARMAEVAAYIAVLVLPLCLLCAHLGYAVPLSGALRGLRAWFAGASRKEIMDALGLSYLYTSLANEKSLQSDSSMVQADGSYYRYSTMWFNRYITRLNSTHSAKEVD